MKLIAYLTVSTQFDGDASSKAVIKYLEKDFEILSAVSDGSAVHYILVKDDNK